MIGPLIIPPKTNLPTLTRTGYNVHHIRSQSDADGLSGLTLGNYDQVLFEAGKTFRVSTWDVQANYVYVGRFGLGNDPIISGSTEVQNLAWTDEGGGIYSCAPVNPTKWLHIEGQQARMAQIGTFTLQGAPTLTTLTVDHANVSAHTITGAIIVANTTNFRFSTEYIVDTYDGAGTITLNRTSDDGLPTSFGAGQKYYLLNKQSFISADYDWAYESGRLYVKLPSDPSNYTISSYDLDYAFGVQEGLQLHNLEIKHYFEAGVKNVDQDNLSVHKCNIHDIRMDGVTNHRKTTGHSYRHNTIFDCGTGGIFMKPSSDLDIKHNEIYNIGVGRNWGWPSSDVDRGVVVGIGVAGPIDVGGLTDIGENINIEHNQVYNTAYNGISLNAAQRGKIRYNVVHDCLKVLHDGGGIYLFHYRGTDLPTTNFEIAFNHVYNISGAGDGYVGIYMDNRSRANHIHHNTVTACEWGILANIDTEAMVIEDNITYDCDYHIVLRRHTGFPQPQIYPASQKHQMHRNILIAKDASERLIRIFRVDSSGAYNPFGDGGSSDNNYYIVPSGTAIGYSDVTDADITLSQLQAITSTDGNSQVIVKTGLITKNETGDPTSDTAPASYTDINGNSVTDYIIPAYFTKALIPE